MLSPVVFFSRDGETAQCAKRMIAEVSNDIVTLRNVIRACHDSIFTCLAIAANPNVIPPNEKGVPYTYDILKEMLLEHKENIDKYCELVRKKYWHTDEVFGQSWQVGKWYEKYHENFRGFIRAWGVLQNHFDLHLGVPFNRKLRKECDNIRTYLLFWHILPVINDYTDEYNSSDPKINAFFNLSSMGGWQSANNLLVVGEIIIPFFLGGLVVQALSPCIGDTRIPKAPDPSDCPKPLFF